MMNFSGNIPISGWSYSTFSNDSVSLFDRLLEIFKELLTYTSGDFDEALDWLQQITEILDILISVSIDLKSIKF